MLVDIDCCCIDQGVLPSCTLLHVYASDTPRHYLQVKGLTLLESVIQNQYLRRLKTRFYWIRLDLYGKNVRLHRNPGEVDARYCMSPSSSDPIDVVNKAKCENEASRKGILHLQRSNGACAIGILRQLDL